MNQEATKWKIEVYEEKKEILGTVKDEKWRY